MTITRCIAEEALNCWRCRQIGITEPTILPGAEYFAIASTNHRAACCGDCFERLQEELAEVEG